jgi:hypothetical protein
LKTGAVKSVEDELKKIDDEIKNNLPTAIAKWAQVVHAALGKIGQWQGLEFEATRKSIFDGTDPAKSIDVVKTRELARKLTIFDLEAGLIQDLAGQVLGQLTNLNLRDLKSKLDECRTALDGVQMLKDITSAQISGGRPGFRKASGRPDRCHSNRRQAPERT